MFERFTDSARRVVVLAQEEARLLRHNYIGTEHLLLGLIHESDGVAATLLESFSISLTTARSQVEGIIARGESPPPTGHIPFTPRAKKVHELSLREAVQLGHDHIGTEHLLLGLIREAAGNGQGVAARTLESLSAPLDTIRQRVVAALDQDHLPSRDDLIRSTVPPSPWVRDLLALARQEALDLGHNYVGNEHLFLAVLRDREGVAAKALTELGADLDQVRHQIARITSDQAEPA